MLIKDTAKEEEHLLTNFNILGLQMHSTEGSDGNFDSVISEDEVTAMALEFFLLDLLISFLLRFTLGVGKQYAN